MHRTLVTGVSMIQMTVRHRIRDTNDVQTWYLRYKYSDIVSVIQMTFRNGICDTIEFQNIVSAIMMTFIHRIHDTIYVQTFYLRYNELSDTVPGIQMIFKNRTRDTNATKIEVILNY